MTSPTKLSLSETQSQDNHTEFNSKKSYAEENWIIRFFRYCKRNPSFLIGLAMLVSLLRVKELSALWESALHLMQHLKYHMTNLSSMNLVG